MYSPFCVLSIIFFAITVHNIRKEKEARMHKNIDGNGWVKKYRIWLMVLLAVVVIWSGWYCISSIRKDKVPEDATLVQGEVSADEGEA
jgi:uncharacterized membrane protein (DUF106 family)